jgi:hypothetical protein
MKISSRHVKPPVNCCLVLSRLVINFCNKIRYNKDIGILCLHSDRLYDNLILGIHTMSIWFWS